MYRHAMLPAAAVLELAFGFVLRHAIDAVE